MRNPSRGQVGDHTPIESAGPATKPWDSEVNKSLIETGKKTPSEGFDTVTEPRVPHISLVFREMWDTTNLDRQPSTERTNTHG
jgi:hypothetical protein